jgi:hypothetical protein
MTGSMTSGTLYSLTVGGTSVLSFKPKNGGGASLISAPQLVKGSAYVLYTGGSYSGGTSTNNLYQGGTFSTTGATTKKSGTLSTTSCTNTISF